MMRPAFLVGIEKVLVSSSNPETYRIRPGASQLLKWLASRGDVYLNTPMPAATACPEMTLDCRTLLTLLGCEGLGIRRWSFTEMNTKVVKQSRGLEFDYAEVVRKTTGISVLVEKGFTPVYVDVPPFADERLDLERCHAIIIEVPAWALNDAAVVDASAHRDRAVTKALWPPAYSEVAKSAAAGRSFVVLSPVGNALVPSAHLTECIQEVIQKAVATGHLAEEKSHEDTTELSQLLRQVWIVQADEVDEVAFLTKSIFDPIVEKIVEALGSEPVQKASMAALDWNGPKESLTVAHEDVPDPFAGFPVRPPEEDV